MSWWKTAKVGDKVVCVDIDMEARLVVGAIYTIAEIRLSREMVIDVEMGCFTNEGCGIRVVEVACRDVNSWFHCRRFQPVETKSTETGMAILKRILNGAPVSEDA